MFKGPPRTGRFGSAGLPLSRYVSTPTSSPNVYCAFPKSVNTLFADCPPVITHVTLRKTYTLSPIKSSNPNVYAALPVIPARGGCRNEKKPPSVFASSMNKSSGTRMAPCAATAAVATPNACSITLPALDMKKMAAVKKKKCQS